VSRKIVHDDVDLAPSGLRLDDGLQEADEFRAGVARGGAPDDLACLRIERRVERQRAVPARPGDSGSTGSSRSRA
jgi:hypothetical protein